MVAARQRKAVQGKPRGTEAQKNISRGTAKMKAAADKALENNSEKIADSLLNGVIRGDNMSVKLLFALAEGQIDCEDEAVVRHLCSLAEKLAAEPQWTGEEIEAEDEINDTRELVRAVLQFK